MTLDPLSHSQKQKPLKEPDKTSYKVRQGADNMNYNLEERTQRAARAYSRLDDKARARTLGVCAALLTVGHKSLDKFLRLYSIMTDDEKTTIEAILFEERILNNENS